MMRTLWFKVAALLIAVWVVAGGVMWWMAHSKPTPEKLAAYLAANPLEGKPPATRGKAIEKVAAQLNGLSYDERREMRMGRKLDGFFRSLNPAEQSRFLDLTLPTGFKQMMDAFNKMDAERRKKFVERTLNEMQKDEGDGAPPIDDPHVQKIVQQGLRSFYSDASADVKMDFAPLLEQMQKNLQFGR
jgi:hypothetical protein